MDVILRLSSVQRQLEVASAVTESAATLAGFKKGQAKRLGRALASGLRDLAGQARTSHLPLRLIWSIVGAAVLVDVRWHRSLSLRSEPPAGWNQVRSDPQSCSWRVHSG